MVSLFTAVAATRAILGTMGRHARDPPAERARGERPPALVGRLIHGQLAVVLHALGTILLVRRDRDRRARDQLRHRLCLRHPDHRPRSSTTRRCPRVDHAIESLNLTTGTGSAKQSIGSPIVQAGRKHERLQARREHLPDLDEDARRDPVALALDPSASPGTVAYVLDKEFGLRQGSLNITSVRAELRETVEHSAVARDHRFACWRSACTSRCGLTGSTRSRC